MGTMNISLPDDMKEFIARETAERGYGTASEYVRDLVRREQDRQKMRALILEGMASGPGPVADDAYFESLRERVRRARAAQAKPGAAPVKGSRAR
jgi:antitoxin ParD1/3/4